MSNRKLWNEIDQIDYIKNCMINENIKIISFDIFDTLLKRPFYYPEDLFKLLDKRFEKYTNSHIHFSKMRTEGEIIARNKIESFHKWQDVTLEEIYLTIENVFKIPHEICLIMQSEEIILEKKFCRPRRSGKDLYKYSLLSGKKIVFISDMYLPQNVIADILNINGYKEYDNIYISSELRKRKSKGDIYKYVLNDLKAQPENMLHIGDNWLLDCITPKELGISVIHFPKTLDIFENKDKNFGTNNCNRMAEKICGQFIDYEQIEKSLGFRCMHAMVANNYFDNPYRKFNIDSDFNQDPYLIGYYLLGMHLIGILQWMKKILKCHQYKKILFMSRDGWLIKEAYEILRDYEPELPKASYIYASRKSVLPAMINTRLDFYELPIDVENYSCEKLLKLIDFCIKDEKLNYIKDWCKQESMLFEDNFSNKEKYYKFIDFIWENCYDSEKHQHNLELAQGYFEQVGEGDIFFDMGYSARIQFAVNNLSQRNSDVIFIHSDSERHYELASKGNFTIYSFYDFIPYMSDILREITMSEYEKSCIGYRQINGKVEPIFSDIDYNIESKIIIDDIQRGAIDFINEFYQTFHEYLEIVSFKSQEVSMPWEGFLRFHNKADRKIFESMELEDEVFMGEQYMNIANMLEERIKWLPDYAK